MSLHAKYIAIEGPIGVGKTSLARRLAATFESDLILEGADENPFLETFYDDPKHGALPTQLFFLFQRAKQIQKIRQTDMFQSIYIADYLIEKDRLFAELTLNQQEFELYENVYSNLTIEAPRPDLVIYLQAPTDVLLSRIAGRGIAYEQTMGGDYLQQLSEAYMKMFYNYQDAPLLIVNAQHIDWVNSDVDYELLLNEITKIKHGRHFFNPGM